MPASDKRVGKDASPLEQVRAAMRDNDLDAYIVHSSDPHQSEYPPPRWNVRRFLSGFTGSSGLLVLTAERAGLWTDSRYAVQAREQLRDSGVELFVTGLPDSITPSDFLEKELESGDRVGSDENIIACKPAKELGDKLSEAGMVFDPGPDLIGPLWEDRPAPPSDPIVPHPIEFAGRSRGGKLADLRAKMKEKKLDAWIVSALDSLAWLFNLRGGDGICAPLATGYGLIFQDHSILFADPEKISSALREDLEEDGISIADYAAVGSRLAELESETAVGLDPARTALGLKRKIPSECDFKEFTDLVGELKCIKNSVEQENLRRFQIRDGVAVVKFLVWLDSKLGDPDLTELSTAERLLELRREQGAVGLSFETIAAYGPNGALPHYLPTLESARDIKPAGFALFDSGGQYPGATTDITRTVACGTLRERMRRDYTLVLMGLVDLSRQIFTEDAKGSNLDLLARRPLWMEGLDFKHGTGHGVGSYLNVHEGPCGISPRSDYPLKPGMVLTIEPGLYREGEYGIRIENIVLVEEERETEFGKFLGFRTVTLAPFDRRAIEIGMLSPEQIEWIDRYHRAVCETLSPELEPGEREWLIRMTAPLL